MRFFKHLQMGLKGSFRPNQTQPAVKTSFSCCLWVWWSVSSILGHISFVFLWIVTLIPLFKRLKPVIILLLSTRSDEWWQIMKQENKRKENLKKETAGWHGVVMVTTSPPTDESDLKLFFLISYEQRCSHTLAFYRVRVDDTWEIVTFLENVFIQLPKFLF